MGSLAPSVLVCENAKGALNRVCALCRHAFSADASVGSQSAYNVRLAIPRGGSSLPPEGWSGSLARRRFTSCWRASSVLRWASAISATRLMRSFPAAHCALSSTISLWLSSRRSPRRRLGAILPDGAGPSRWVATTVTRLFPLSEGELLSVPSVGGPGITGTVAYVTSGSRDSALTLSDRHPGGLPKVVRTSCVRAFPCPYPGATRA